MSTVTIADNVYDPSTWETIHGVQNINELLSKRYGAHFPSTGRIYFRYVAESCDVTPHNDKEIDRLEKLDGNFFVMIYPETFLVVAIIIAVVLAAVAITLAILFRNTAKPNTSSSPNNSLSDRQNGNRPGERIPDIVGTVRSTPDLIAIPYRVFIGNQEVEFDYMCVGRGHYVVSQATELTGSVTGPVVYDIKEDQTFVEQINGNSVAVYAPFTSPNSGDAPVLQIGPSIYEPIKNVAKSSSVIGQILRAPNDQSVRGNNNIRAVFGGILDTNDSNIDFTAYFAIGDNLNLNFNNAIDPAHVRPDLDLDGTYVILSVTTTQITLNLLLPGGSPVNPNWPGLSSFSGGASNYQSAVLIASGSRIIGPYVLDVGTLTEVWFNFVAENGLFKISSSSGTQYGVNDIITGCVQCLDENYVPVGEVISQSATVYGSAILQTQRATTLKVVLPRRSDGKPAGRVHVWAVRISPYDPTWQGTNEDIIQWRDLYAVSPIEQTHFGNVTTLQTMSYATPSALLEQSRKLNLEVTRMWPQLDPTTHLPIVPTNLLATTNAADIIVNLALDPYIGGRQISEIDWEGIYATIGPGGAVDEYFGNSYCSEFCYTFDDTQTSFEEMMTDIGQACFFQPFRRGRLFEIFFEQQTDTSTLLFNHRNKIPSSEIRTVAFGLTNDYDGIELDYIDPKAPNYPELETTVTLYFPPLAGDPTKPGSATNPRKIKTVGIRNNVQATTLGWRLYQKMIYQNTTVEFRATAEASLVVNTQRILVADNTRPDTQDGEVIQQNGLQLVLSQPVVFAPGQFYVIFLQHYDGTVESIPISEDSTNGNDPNRGVVLLSRVPLSPLVLDRTMFAVTTYQVSGPPNETYQSSNIYFEYNTITSAPNAAVMFTDQNFLNVQADDIVQLIGIVLTDPGGTHAPINASGTYTVVERPGLAILALSQGSGEPDLSSILSFTPAYTSITSGKIRIIRPQAEQATPFLLGNKEAEDGLVFKCQAINYDDRYYDHDADFINGTLVLNGSTESSVGFGYSGSGGGVAGSGATFNMNSSLGEDSYSNPVYRVSSVDVVSGGSGYPMSAVGQLSGTIISDPAFAIYSDYTETCYLTIDPTTGAITGVSNDSSIEWETTPSFSIV